MTSVFGVYSEDIDHFIIIETMNDEKYKQKLYIDEEGEIYGCRGPERKPVM